MSDTRAWGDAWGDTWGDAWGADSAEEEPPEPPVIVAQTPVNFWPDVSIISDTRKRKRLKHKFLLLG